MRSRKQSKAARISERKVPSRRLWPRDYSRITFEIGKIGMKRPGFVRQLGEILLCTRNDVKRGQEPENGSTELPLLGRIDDLERDNLRLRSLIARDETRTGTKTSNCLCVRSQCAKYQRNTNSGGAGGGRRRRAGHKWRARGTRVYNVSDTYEVASIKWLRIYSLFREGNSGKPVPLMRI